MLKTQACIWGFGNLQRISNFIMLAKFSLSIGFQFHVLSFLHLCKLAINPLKLL